jgi:hypothetical protein
MSILPVVKRVVASNLRRAKSIAKSFGFRMKGRFGCEFCMGSYADHAPGNPRLVRCRMSSGRKVTACSDCARDSRYGLTVIE